MGTLSRESWTNSRVRLSTTSRRVQLTSPDSTSWCAKSMTSHWRSVTPTEPRRFSRSPETLSPRSSRYLTSTCRWIFPRIAKASPKRASEWSVWRMMSSSVTLWSRTRNARPQMRTAQWRKSQAWFRTSSTKTRQFSHTSFQAQEPSAQVGPTLPALALQTIYSCSMCLTAGTSKGSS